MWNLWITPSRRRGINRAKEEVTLKRDDKIKKKKLGVIQMLWKNCEQLIMCEMRYQKDDQYNQANSEKEGIEHPIKGNSHLLNFDCRDHVIPQHLVKWIINEVFLNLIP